MEIERKSNLYQAYMNGAAILRMNLTETNPSGAVIALLVLLTLLMITLYIVRCHTVRIYNWNGQRYCYLGHAVLRSVGGGYLVRIGERMADLSDTTLYQICPSKGFIRRNRYKELLLCAGKAQCTLPVEEQMRQSIYYK